MERSAGDLNGAELGRILGENGDLRVGKRLAHAHVQELGDGGLYARLRDVEPHAELDQLAVFGVLQFIADVDEVDLSVLGADANAGVVDVGTRSPAVGIHLQAALTAWPPTLDGDTRRPRTILGLDEPTGVGWPGFLRQPCHAALHQLRADVYGERLRSSEQVANRAQRNLVRVSPHRRGES